MTIPPIDFRHCLGRFATGVTVITTADNTNAPCGVTINSFASVSLEPPLVLFCLDKSAHTYPIFCNAERFVVNILSENQKDISSQFAHPTGVNWEQVSYRTNDNGLPILSETLAHLECDKEILYEGGDHTIFIGRVVALTQNSDAKPLLYYKGSYNRMGDIS